MKHLIRWSFYILVLTGMFFPGCGSKSDTTDMNRSPIDSIADMPLKEEVFGVARIEPEHDFVTVSAGTSGKILSVLITENEDITPDQEVLKLDNSLEKAELEQSESKLITHDAAEKVAMENLRQAEIELQNAQRNLNLAKELLEGRAQTQKAVDDAQAEVDRLRQVKKTSEANLEQVRLQRKTLEADIHYYQTKLSNKKILAPTNGKILNVLVHAGEYINNESPVFEFAPVGGIIAKTEVDELFASKVAAGQKAVIYSQITGEELAQGTVIFAADYLQQKSLFKNQSTELEDRRVREVKVRLEEGNFPLFGSRVDCRIFLTK